MCRNTAAVWNTRKRCDSVNQSQTHPYGSQLLSKTFYTFRIYFGEKWEVENPNLCLEQPLRNCRSRGTYLRLLLLELVSITKLYKAAAAFLPRPAWKSLTCEWHQSTFSFLSPDSQIEASQDCQEVSVAQVFSGQTEWQICLFCWRVYVTCH